MDNLSLLNDRLSELGSGIIKITEEKVYLTGFLNSERLLDYYNNNNQCFFSKGIYDVKNLSLDDLDLYSLKPNSLFYILNNKNDLISKIEFKNLKRDTVTIKHNKKQTTLTFEIKKCIYSNKYIFDSSSDKELFYTYEDLVNYLLRKYNYILSI